ncbi:MAG: hypothetical protein ACPGO5_02900 [Patescibacteria group bacterium]
MYTLTPIIHPQIHETLSDTKKIKELKNAFGSPLNLIYPEVVTENLEQFHKIFADHKIKGEVFYAHKANKSVAILKQLSLINCNIDVASEKELQQALSAGFAGTRIEATGPKSRNFIRLALQHGVTMNLNSPSELATILELRDKLHLTSPTPIFIRLKEFKSSQIDIIQKDAKFGFNINNAKEALATIHTKKNELNFIGFSFHLTTTSEKERILAIEQCLHLTLESLKLGFNPKGINIGGGFSLNYLESSAEWNSYVSAIKDSLLDPAKPSMSWNQTGLGLWAENGKIRGAAKFSDFYRAYDQFEELNRVLNAKLPTFGTISQFLQENMLQVFIEPGRSMLDQAGITLATVESINTSLKNETVIFLNMNRSHIGSIELEFMSDPLIVSNDENNKTKATNGVFLSGNLCLPHDFICRRKVFLPHLPAPGDILAFINTAGYFMDFTESKTIQHPIAPKLAISSSGWALDEKYAPSIH